MTPEERLADLGLELPPPTPPVAVPVRAATAGSLVFVSGHGPSAGGAAAPFGTDR